MANKTTGWLIFAAALGMMLSLISVDVNELTSWHDATTPSFVGTAMAHFGAVIAAFVGGKLIPTESN